LCFVYFIFFFPFDFFLFRRLFLRIKRHFPHLFFSSSSILDTRRRLFHLQDSRRAGLTCIFVVQQRLIEGASLLWCCGCNCNNNNNNNNNFVTFNGQTLTETDKLSLGPVGHFVFHIRRPACPSKEDREPNKQTKKPNFRASSALPCVRLLFFVGVSWRINKNCKCIG
jgi:hypothetical protein